MSAPAALVVAAGLADDQGLPALAERLRLRGAVCAVLAGRTAPRAVLTAIAGCDGVRSWLATADPVDIPAAATAGLAGVVLIGLAGTDRDDGILVRHAPALADAPVAMVPRGGGCWHSGA